MIDIHYVSTVSELYDLWPRVREGLLDIFNKTHSVMRPEDIYHEII